LDKSTKYNSYIRQIKRFEKIRNKYIYIHKRKEINEIEIDDDGLKEDKLYISPQTNYSFYPANSFTFVTNVKSEKESSKYIHNCIFLSILLFIIFILLAIFSLYLIQKMLKKFDVLIIKAWLLQIIFIITIINFILYYIKMLIGGFLLFRFYHIRKKRCLCRALFWLFVDKSMVHIYKVRNLITKYKKEFDYL